MGVSNVGGITGTWADAVRSVEYAVSPLEAQATQASVALKFTYDTALNALMADLNEEENLHFALEQTVEELVDGLPLMSDERGCGC